jgi:hypothetical protein
MDTKENAKGALVEKLLFAILPLLLGATTHLLTSLNQIKEDVTVLNQKISLVVTSDNKQASNTGAELAREKLKEELKKEIQQNRDQIQVNRLHIALLQQKLKFSPIAELISKTEE